MSITLPTDDSAETRQLLSEAADGDENALAELVERHRQWLLQFAAARLDPRLRARVDATDVVQDTLTHVCERFQDYLRRRPVSFRVWLMKSAYDQLGKLKRFHIVTEGRSVLREVPLDDRSSLALAKQLVANRQSAWAGLVLEDLARKVQNAVGRLSPMDREVLLLRFVEGLDNQEIGYLLELEPGTVSKRCGRALLRLHTELIAEGVEGSDR